MNNDNRDDQDGSPDGDAEQQMGFDSNSFDSTSTGNRQDRFFSAFDDETTEIDDIEPGDYGDDFDADDDLLADDRRDDDTIDLWGEESEADAGESASGLNAAEELKALWDDDPAPDPQDTSKSLSDSPTATAATNADPDDDAPDFADWPHEEPEEIPEPPEQPPTAEDDSAWTEEDEFEPEPAAPEPAASGIREPEWEEPGTAQADASELEPEAPELWDLADEEDEEPLADASDDEWRTAAAAALSTAASVPARETGREDQADDWDTAADEDDPDETWDDEDWDDEDATPDRKLPWGLIAVAGVALLLLGVGGFGILQERGALQDEVTELRSQLATSASPEEVSEARESVRSLEESTRALEDEIERLQLENRRLTDMVTGLESQLKNQAEAAEALERSAEQARAAAARQSTAPTATAAAGSGTWFVNFGSYGNREIAEEWATRLRKNYGKVIVAPAASQGRSLYRVRVIGLASKAEAERVARQLEQAHDLSKLWVGSE